MIVGWRNIAKLESNVRKHKDKNGQTLFHEKPKIILQIKNKTVSKLIKKWAKRMNRHFKKSINIQTFGKRLSNIDDQENTNQDNYVLKWVRDPQI